MAMFYQIRSEFDFPQGLKGGQLTPFLATLNPKLSNVGGLQWPPGPPASACPAVMEQPMARKYVTNEFEGF